MLKMLAFDSLKRVFAYSSAEGGGRWYSLELVLVVCLPVLQILILFQTKLRHFPYLTTFFHTFSDLATFMRSRDSLT